MFVVLIYSSLTVSKSKSKSNYCSLLSLKFVLLLSDCLRVVLVCSLEHLFLLALIWDESLGDTLNTVELEQGLSDQVSFASLGC